MADNDTEVISQGGEHGAVCMKTFNGQYNTDSEMGNIKLSLRALFFFAVAYVMIQGGRDLKVKGDSPEELLVSLGLFNTILGVCIYICVHLVF